MALAPGAQGEAAQAEQPHTLLANLNAVVMFGFGMHPFGDLTGAGLVAGLHDQLAWRAVAHVIDVEVEGPHGFDARLGHQAWPRRVNADA